ncbi:ribose 5-phosphate isomerase B [Candidatus Woesearchaeota archaeon]|nr:ribose 5-phosphate isomerase B [Candidatus Woesearchaeota archaeon]
MQQTKIFLGADHAGFRLKEEIKKYLDNIGYKYEDLGAYTDKTPCDYPETALNLAKKVAKSNGKGILMCGTGTGEAIVANKVKGIKAANCFNEYTAKMSREHNNSNVLCIGARVIDAGNAKKIAKAWLETEFSKEPRHRRRVKQIENIEKTLCK